MNPFKIRLANVSDLEAINHIEDDSFSEPYPHGLLAKLLREHPNNFFVAEVQPGTVVGYCVATKKGKAAHLVSIGVLREYRRRGIGTALIEELFAILCSGVRKLRLEVKQENMEAIRLYEGLGFRQVSVIENYYTDGSPAVKMQLTLPHKFQGCGEDSGRSDS